MGIFLRNFRICLGFLKDWKDLMGFFELSKRFLRILRYSLSSLRDFSAFKKGDFRIFDDFLLDFRIFGDFLTGIEDLW